MPCTRKIICLNRGWRFHPGDDLPKEALSFGNSQIISNETNLWQKAGNFGISRPENPYTKDWRIVDVPHDYALEGTFSHENSVEQGSLPHGKAWYVKTFDLAPEDRDKRIHLEFDGIFRNCQVSVNGHFVGRHLSGYTSFGCDISELCFFGAENAVAVFVDARDNELWSYEGAGIYRSVRLVKTSPVFVPQWGSYVTSGSADDPGAVSIELNVRNMSYEDANCEISNEILSPDGKPVARIEPTTMMVRAIAEHSLTLTSQIETPELWSIDNPKLYTLVTTIGLDGEIVDRYETSFGLRYFHFDPEQGFFLNGRHLKLQGVCCHQDHGCVGVAVPPKLQEWRVARLKEMGCNAIRTSHNPPDPALLDACDRLGMLVMDEIRIPGIAEELLGQLEDTVRRDRNHPSVILWSIGNEEMTIQETDSGIRIFRRMQHLAHTLDPSRPTTYGMNCDWISICDFHNDSDFRVDVFGANYRSGQHSEHYDEFHQEYPDWPLIGTETFGGGSTRGLYEPDKSQLPVNIAKRWLGHPDLWRDDKYSGFASAYGGTFTPWGYSIEETWQDCANRPFMAGTFIWTGFDYRGETFPYDWPSVVTRFGILDMCGFYKEIAHYLRSWWRPDDPHIFLMPHWNWTGREGEIIDVWCYANCAEVELLLNGGSLGRKSMPKNFRLEWQVPFTPGKLEAIGYNREGERQISTYRRTTGAPAGIRLSPWSTTIQADGNDIIIVDAAVIDKEGDVCPLADTTLTFSVEGPLKILGVGNGNPMSHEPETRTTTRKAFHGLAQVILQSTEGTGINIATLNVTGKQLTGASESFPISGMHEHN